MFITETKTSHRKKKLLNRIEYGKKIREEKRGATSVSSELIEGKIKET